MVNKISPPQERSVTARVSLRIGLRERGYVAQCCTAREIPAVRTGCNDS